MWDYSEKVKEHFYHPRNAGAVAGANAVGDVGSMSCGDALRLSLRIDPLTEVIEDAGFQTFGCGSAIASSSALTEIIKGMTVTEALRISNQDIADYLDGLPPEKMHCSVMGREALQAAVANFRGVTRDEEHEEGALVCKCFAVDEVMVRETVRANHLKSVEDVMHYTKAGGGCSSCHEKIEQILGEMLEERGEVFVAAPVKSLPGQPEEVVAIPLVSGMTHLERIRRIERVLQDMRPHLQMDHGDVELLDVDGRTVYVRLTGHCTACQMAGMTLSAIQQKLMEALGEFIKVIPVAMDNQMAGGVV